MKKILLIALGLALASPSFAQSGDPAAGSASSPRMNNPSGSGTSTSGGRDYNNDQGRDKMGTTGQGQGGSQYNQDTGSSQPGQPNVTGQQKSGTNAEGTAKP